MGSLLLVYVRDVALLCLLHNDLQPSCTASSKGLAVHNEQRNTPLQAPFTHRDSVRVLVTDASSLGLAFLCGPCQTPLASAFHGGPVPGTDGHLDKFAPWEPSGLHRLARRGLPSGCSSLKDFGRADMMALLALEASQGLPGDAQGSRPLHSKQLRRCCCQAVWWETQVHKLLSAAAVWQNRPRFPWHQSWYAITSLPRTLPLASAPSMQEHPSWAW